MTCSQNDGDFASSEAQQVEFEKIIHLWLSESIYGFRRDQEDAMMKAILEMRKRLPTKVAIKFRYSIVTNIHVQPQKEELIRDAAKKRKVEGEAVQSIPVCLHASNFLPADADLICSSCWPESRARRRR